MNIVLEKQTRVKFNKGIHTLKHNLEYIHSNLWDYASTQSLSGSRYFLSFIDDHSRKIGFNFLV